MASTMIRSRRRGRSPQGMGSRSLAFIHISGRERISSIGYG
jgi:hypothetical protein